MYVVTVTFTVLVDHLDEFRAAMVEQARASLEGEPGCHQFDVGVDPAKPTVIFLYELYTDKAAFEAHLETAHFKAFDAEVAPWVTSKTVQAYERVWPPS